MKKINFNFRAKDEFHNDLPVTVGEALIGGFKRASLQDEHLIRKVQVFIDKIESGEFELDEADLKLFKELMLNTDLVQVIKIEVLRILDKIEKHG